MTTVNSEFKSTLTELHTLNPVQFRMILKFVEMSNLKGEVVLNAGVKRQIAKEIEIKKSTLDNCLSQMNKAQILVRVDAGIYKVKDNIYDIFNK